MTRPMWFDDEITRLGRVSQRATQLERRPAPSSGGATEVVLQLPIVDPSTLVVTGDGQRYLIVSDDMNGLSLVDADASLSTATTSGTVTVQIRRQRSGSDVDMLSTRITIDATEKTSYTAAAAAVINTSNDDVLTADLVFIDVDVAGSNGRGLVVVLSFA